MVPPLGAALMLIAAAGCSGETAQLAVAAPDKELRVAAGSTDAAAGRAVIVPATDPRTHLGHFRTGQRVQIAIEDGQWNDVPGPDLYDARGSKAKRCMSDWPSACIGHGAPLMGLVLITVPDAIAALPESECQAQRRLYIPNGVEFEAPFDVELALAPNDWEDGLYNNSGAILVEVERASSKRAAATERKAVEVRAVAPRTFAGQFARGEYVRITVKGGEWNHHPGAQMFGSEGNPGGLCGDPGHTCIGGESQPLMGLVLLMSACDRAATSMRNPKVERAYIPDGVEVVLASDANLYLAPNDREDDLANNSGSIRVRVRTFDK